MSQSDFVTRGQALVSAGQFQEAVKVCRLGLLGRPTTVEGRVVLGQALLALKRYDEVLAEMRVALELDHASLPAQVLKGEALLRKGDPHGAVDVLQRARTQSPSDPKVIALLAEAKRGAGMPVTTASHPSVGFVSGDHGENTRHYPNHGAEEEDTSDSDDGVSSGDSYTKPTSLSAPGAKKKTPPPAVQQPTDATPPPAVLAVGDRSGTVEVDPDAEGVEVDGEIDDFGDIAAPPQSRGPLDDQPGAIKRGPARVVAEGRGQVVPASRKGDGLKQTKHGRAPAPFSLGKAELPVPRRPRKKVDISTVELEDDEMIEVPGAETVPLTKQPAPGPGTAVRNAVNLPSGPLAARVPTAASRPTAVAPAVAPPPHLAQLLAAAPNVHTMMGSGGPMVRPNPIAAALPTMAAQPSGPFHNGQPSMTLPAPVAPMPINPAAVRPTMAIAPPPHAPDLFSPVATPDLFNGPPGMYQPPVGSDPGQSTRGRAGEEPSPAWARATVAAVPPPPMAMPMPMLPPEPSASGAAALPMLEPSQSGARALKTGMRRTRSKLQIAIWFLIGALVIGGGVFAGFQIRAMRLTKQIAAAREQAITLAKADTWKGWIGARDRLAGIAQASPTIDNVAALARTRALVAYEFGDGMAEAKVAYDQLSTQNGVADIELTGAYLALAQSDPKAARAAADRALALAPEDPAVLYVSGQAALLDGDTAGAIKNLKAAVDREARPIYMTALARAYAAGAMSKEALAEIDQALTASPDHPGALVERAELYIATGQPAKATETKGLLVKITAEGGKPINDQPRGVSPLQVALTYLVLARIDYLRGDAAGVSADITASAAVHADDQIFVESTIDTLYAVDRLTDARSLAEKGLALFPPSRPLRISLARVWIALGKPGEAIDVLGKITEIKELPVALAVRGQAHLAAGDLDPARTDFDNALKKAPNLEAALVGRAWIDLDGNDAAAAKKRLAKADMTSTAVATVYAATLRMLGEAGARDQARQLLEKAVKGPPGPELARAQLELARIYREVGDPRAMNLYADAAKAGSFDAKLESGLLLIDTGNPDGGREQLDMLVKTTTPPPAALLLEAARARALVGEHAGATALLEQANKSGNAPHWKVERERGRIALRTADYTGAARALDSALDGCGDDLETFLLAADTAVVDDKQMAKLADKVRQLVKARLKNKIESEVVLGKLVEFTKPDEAFKAFDEAQALVEKTPNTPQLLKAQVNLGRGIAKYFDHDDQVALPFIELAFTLDPSIYEAYVYYADMKKDKDPQAALAKAELSVKYNPAFVEGIEMVGIVAHKLRNMKLLDEQIRKLGDIEPQGPHLKNLMKLRSQ